MAGKSGKRKGKRGKGKGKRGKGKGKAKLQKSGPLLLIESYHACNMELKKISSNKEAHGPQWQAKKDEMTTGLNEMKAEILKIKEITVDIKEMRFVHMVTKGLKLSMNISADKSCTVEDKQEIKDLCAGRQIPFKG